MNNTLNLWQRKTLAFGSILFIFFSFCIPISLAVENTGFILTLLFALMSGLWWTYRQEIFRNLWILLLLLLVFLFVIGVFYTASDHVWALRALKKEGGILAIIFLLPLVINDECYLLQCLKSFVYGCLIVYLTAVLGNYHYLPAWSIFQHPAPYYSFFKIYAALFMAFGAFIALNLMVHKETHRFWRFFWALCFILISYNVLWQSLSRTGYIIYFVLLLVFFIMQSRLIITILGILLTVILFFVVTMASSNLNTGLNQVVDNYHSARQGNVATSGGIRMEYFSNSVKLWQEKPFFGQGTGGYRTADVNIGGITASGEVTNHAAPQVTPENTFYRILVEQGAVGIVLFLTLLGLQVYYSFFKLTGLRRKMAIGFILTILIASFSQDLIFDESPRLFYILFTVLLYAPIWLKSPNRSVER